MCLPEIRDKHGQTMNSCKWRLELALKYGSRAHSTMVSQLLTLISHFLVALEADAFCLSLQALRLRQMSVHYRLTGREHCPPAIHKQPMKTAGFGKGCPFRLKSESWTKKSENWSGSLWVWLLTQWLTKLAMFHWTWHCAEGSVASHLPRKTISGPETILNHQESLVCMLDDHRFPWNFCVLKGSRPKVGPFLFLARQRAKGQPALSACDIYSAFWF